MRRALITAASAIALVIAGCGSEDETAPAACLSSQSTYLASLSNATRPVRLNGRVPISSCLVKNQSAGELTTVGRSMVATATILNASARRLGESRDATQNAAAAGYLVGAAQRGAADTAGIHTDLLRRLKSAGGGLRTTAVSNTAT